MTKAISYIRPHTFLHDYMLYARDRQISDMYALWSGVWIYANVLGRRVQVARPGAPVFLNQFIVLVGPSAMARKSSTIKLADSIVSHFVDEKPLTTRVTGRSLEKYLATLPNGAVARFTIYELATVLGKDITKDLPVVLTDLYDCPEHRFSPATVSRQLEYDHVYVNLIAGSTGEWLLQRASSDIWSGGLGSRFVFVVEHSPKFLLEWEGEQPSDEDTIQSLRDSLRAATAVCPDTIGVSNGAVGAYLSWQRRHRKTRASIINLRRDDQVLKLAAVLCINDGTYVIQLHHMKAAIAIWKTTSDRASPLIDARGASKAERIERLVKRIIEADAKGLTNLALRRIWGEDCGLDLHEVMENMMALDVVRYTTRTQKRAVTYAVATDRAKDKQVIGRLVNMLV